MVMDTKILSIMKAKVFKNYIHIVYGLLLCFLIVSCKKSDELGTAPRIFRPVIKGDLTATANYIEVAWQPIKEAVSYTLEVSRDTFKTIDVSINIDSTHALVEELKWDQLYQLQVRANTADTARNSKFGFLGSIKTPKFPTILKPSTINDVTETSALMKWTNSGAEVTEIKVYIEPERTLLKTIVLNAQDRTNEYKIVSGLTPGTTYFLELYSNTTLRGYNNYTTKAPFFGEVIDLRDILDKPSVLQDTLTKIPSGSMVILKKGLTYTINAGINLAKTVTIISGDDLLVNEPATILLASNFNFSAGSTIDSISFVNVHLKGTDPASKYVFNTTNGAMIDKIKFDNCTAEMFRGFVRLQGGTTTINNFLITNSIIDSIGDYGVLNVDNASCKIENMIIKNSTIARSNFLIKSSKNTNGSSSILIDACTFYKAPSGNTILIDYNTINVTNGVTISNCIFSIGKNNSGNTSPKGIRVGTSTIINTSGNYSTSDYVNSGNAIPSVTAYARPSTDLFSNPLTGDFTIKDMGFPGKSTAGDPRWRP